MALKMLRLSIISFPLRTDEEYPEPAAGTPRALALVLLPFSDMCWRVELDLQSLCASGEALDF